MKTYKKKQENIKRYILELIIDGKKGIAKKTAESFGISEMTVYRYLKSMQEEGIIGKDANGYSLISERRQYDIKLSEETISEDRVYRDCLEPVVSELSKNVRSIWEYCFSEMMNNAIDHSGAENVRILINKNYMFVSVAIIDDGIGIFRKIREYFGYDTTGEVIEELFKGKLTTDSENHSGEGIFFTSRIMDKFAAISERTVFTHDKYDEWQKSIDDLSHGTAIIMQLSNFTRKTSKEIFDEYADIEGGFKRTRIPLKNIYETYPVSRSQAKRLSHRLDTFEEVELDFYGVDEIGQGFAHELFVKYARLHPETKLIPVHTNKTIDNMLRHVQNG